MINPDHTVIGFSGRIGREKNLTTLKAAFERINQEYPDTRLLIVGSGVEEIEQSLIGKNIILAGVQNNVMPYLQAMDIYVMPSLTETSSLSTMEAMATGIPVIVTPVGAMKEYIDHGENGFFFPRKDIDELTQRIRDLLNDTRKRKSMGKAARKTAIESFRWFDTAKSIKDTIKEVLKEKKP